MAVSKRLRYEILRRDNHACRYCGAQAPEVKLTVDHVVPTALGGTDDPSNLVTACASCNSGKTSSSPDAPLVADVEQDALKWARAMERAADLQQVRRDERDGYIAVFDEYWSGWTYGPDKEPIPRDDDWELSLGRFFDLGLEDHVMLRCLDQAMRSKASVAITWRAFCRRAWDVLQERTEMAKEIASSGPERKSPWPFENLPPDDLGQE